MALSELQKLIIGGLNICGLKEGNIYLAILLLKEEEQQWELAEYLETILENPPDSETIMRKVREIAEM